MHYREERAFEVLKARRKGDARNRDKNLVRQSKKKKQKQYEAHCKEHKE